MTFGMPLLKLRAKPDVLQRSLWSSRTQEEYEDVDVKLTGDEKSDPQTNDEALHTCG